MYVRVYSHACLCSCGHVSNPCAQVARKSWRRSSLLPHWDVVWLAASDTGSQVGLAGAGVQSFTAPRHHTPSPTHTPARWCRPVSTEQALPTRAERRQRRIRLARRCKPSNLLRCDLQSLAWKGLTTSAASPQAHRPTGRFVHMSYLRGPGCSSSEVTVHVLCRAMDKAYRTRRQTMHCRCAPVWSAARLARPAAQHALALTPHARSADPCPQWYSERQSSSENCRGAAPARACACLSLPRPARLAARTMRRAGGGGSLPDML
jgi:hypothetical protein